MDAAKKTEIAHVEERPAPVAAPTPATEAAAIFSLVERAARDPSIDIDRMERLMTMGREARAEHAARLFHEAMTAAQGEMPRVTRDARNEHNRSRYARLETIAKAIAPVIARHGFSLSFDMGEAPLPELVRIVCTVAHSAGHARQHHLDMTPDAAGAQGKANKTAIQALGSTVSYGRRYLTLMIFNVALTNEDDDGVGGARDETTISDEQIEQLRDLVDSVGARVGDFLKYLGVEAFAEIPASRFEEAKRALQRKGSR